MHQITHQTNTTLLYRSPPAIPPDVKLFKPFTHKWNQGLHGRVKHKIKQSQWTPTHKQQEEQARTTQDVMAHSNTIQGDSTRAKPDATVDSTHHSEEIAKAKNDAHAHSLNNTNIDKENQTALLYSLNTPRSSAMYQYFSGRSLHVDDMKCLILHMKSGTDSPLKSKKAEVELQYNRQKQRIDDLIATLRINPV
jgi:hypothetical protein